MNNAGQVAGNDEDLVEPEHRAARRVNDGVVVDERGACARQTDTPMPAKALRITLPDMVTSRRYLPQLEMMSKADAFSITLPVTESSAST